MFTVNILIRHVSSERNVLSMMHVLSKASEILYKILSAFEINTVDKL